MSVVRDLRPRLAFVTNANDSLSSPTKGGPRVRRSDYLVDQGHFVDDGHGSVRGAPKRPRLSLTRSIIDLTTGPGGTHRSHWGRGRPTQDECTSVVTDGTE